MLNRFCLMFPVLLLVSMFALAFRRHVKQDFKQVFQKGHPTAAQFKESFFSHDSSCTKVCV